MKQRDSLWFCLGMSLTALLMQVSAAVAAPARGAPALSTVLAQNTPCGNGTTLDEDDINQPSGMPLLSSDEPARIGWTHDGFGKQGFMDFTVSLRYPILFKTLCEGYRYNMLPFFSFTGRFGEYFSRHSSPVLAKRFNPRVFLRFYEPTHDSDRKLWRDDQGLDYFDIGYGHESNGQIVDNQASYDAATATYGNPAYALDYISRGWDYVGYKRHLQMHRWGMDSMDFDLRYFLAYGFMQRGIEEYHGFEAPSQVIHIGQVDGLRLKFNFGFAPDWLQGFSLLLMSGYRDLGKHPTARAEVGFAKLDRFTSFPVIFWAQSGYLSSVAQFNRKTWSVGISASLETFK